MEVFNKKASFDYEIFDRLEAGIALMGAEVKSIKGGHVSLDGAFVRVIGSEAYLVNAQVFPYVFARPEGYDPKRTRKLLLHKKQIISLKTKLDSDRLTLVPLSLYTKGPIVKLSIGVGKGKKQFEKKEKKKNEELKRELEIDFRGKVR